MRRLALILCLAMTAPVFAQQADEAPGLLDRLFGTDRAGSDTEQGSILERLIEDQLSDAGRNVTIQGFTGALSGRATLDSLTITDADGIWLTLEDAVLDWNRAALFSGRLEIAELTAARIDLPRLPAPPEGEAPTPEATGFQLPQLPVSIEIGKIAAESVQIGKPVFGADARVAVNGSLSLVAGEANANLAIERHDGIGALRLEAAYANTTEVLKLDFSLQEAEDGILANLVDLPGKPSINFSVSGDAPISDYAANITLATDGAERLAGTITLNQTESGERRILADISGDIAPVFAPSYRPFFGDAIALMAETRIALTGEISVPDFQLAARAISLNGAVELDRDRMPRRISVAGRIASNDGQHVLLPLSGAETRIDSADLKLDFDAAASEDWTGDIRLAGLDREGLTADTLALAGKGRIIAGNAPLVTAEFDFDARRLETGIIGMTQAVGENLTGAMGISWAGGPVSISGLQVSGKSLVASGDAEIKITEGAPEVSGALDLNAEQLANFSTLANRAISGEAYVDTQFQVHPLSGAFSITIDGQTLDLTVDDPRADAILAGRVELELTAARDADGLRVDLKRLTSEAAEISAKTDLRSGGSTASVSASLEDTSVLLPALRGASRLTFNGREDDRRNWDIQFQLAGPTLDATLDGTLRDLYERPAFAGDIDARASDLSAFAELAGHPLKGSLSLAANGSLTADLLQATLQADVTGNGLAIGQDDLDRLLDGNLSARIEATREGDTIKIAGLDLETALLQAGASGVLSESATELAIRARLANVASFVEGFSGPLTLDGTVAQSGSDLRLDLDTTGPGGTRAAVTGTVAQDLARADLTANGSLPLGLANRFIRPRSLSGTAAFDLRLSGPPDLRNVSGQINTSGARLSAPALGVALGDITGSVSLSGGSASVALQGAVDGGGRLSVTGPVAMATPNNAQLQIDLSRVTLSDPRLYETSVDGTVRVNGPLAGGAAISGALTLGQTDIRIPESGFGGAGDVPEIIHLNEPPPVRGTRRRAGLLNQGTGTRTSGPSFPLDIRVSAPNRIFVRGRGLDSEFGGGLRLTNTTDDIVPLGAFELIRGRLDILGRRLQLEEARITMQGSFTPFIRLRASTDAEDYTVHVDITGPVDNPEIAFTSSPDLPEEEVISRLIFGRGLETLSPLQAARLALAIRTLAGQGGEGIIGKIRGQSGLADLDVTTSEDGNAAVRAGAYLGENIYTDVTVDSAGETELNLNLDITPSLKARGGVSNSGDTSLGIFFERDY